MHAQDLQPRADARLGGAEGHVKGAGDLFVGHVVEERHRDGLALLRRQRLQRRLDDAFVLALPGALLGPRFFVGDGFEWLLVVSLVFGRSAAAAAQLVQDLPVRQPQEPGSERALARIEAACPAPHGQEDFLDELLGGGPIQALDTQVEHQRGIAAVERPQRFLLAPGEVAHQLLVGARRIDKSGCHRLSIYPVFHRVLLVHGRRQRS